MVSGRVVCVGVWPCGIYGCLVVLQYSSFCEVDKDGNGSLSVSEIQRVLTEQGTAVPDDLGNIFHWVDVNHVSD